MEQIKIDIVPVGVASVAHASQFDNGRQIRFDLFNRGTPYTLTGAETVTMVVNGEEENITNTSDNYVIWDVAEEDCEEVGVIGCEIRIVLGSMLIGSKNFFLEVEMDPYNGKNIRIVTVGPADICTFETTLPEPYPSVLANVLATGGNGTPDNPIPIVGYSSANIVNTQNESIVDLFSIDSDFRGTVAFNQINAPANNRTRTAGGVDFTNNNDGSVSVNGTCSGTNNYGISYNVATISGHKLLVCGCVSTSNYWINSNGGESSPVGSNGVIVTSDGNTQINLHMENGAVINTKVYPQIFDLTAMFGSTIADYIYSLEQNNAGEGVAFFRNIYPEDYYAYDSGTTEIVGKETPEAVIAFGQTVYGGVLDVTRGKLRVTHAKKTFTGASAEQWYTYHGGTPEYYQFTTPILDSKNTQNAVINMFELITAGERGIANGLVIDTDKNFRFALLPSENITDEATWRSFLSNNNLEICYELATPIDIDLTPVQISALVGENNVFADCGQTTVEYMTEE